MISTITKRDGRKTDFNKEKIAQAIFKAAKKMGGSDSRDVKVWWMEKESIN